MKIKKKKLNNKLFEKSSPWIPNNLTGRYFERLNLLTPKYNLTNWEHIRIPNLIPRTYEKEKDLPQKKDIKPNNLVGTYFDDIMKKNYKNVNKFGKFGTKLMETFINQNKKMEEKLKKKDEMIFKYKRSKPPVQLNPWKPTNHVREEFTKFKADDVHNFRPEPKKKYLITEPFRIPKKVGDYFYQRPSTAIVHY